MAHNIETHTKRVVFESTSHIHASLVSKLRLMKISQKKFFNSFLELFLKDDEALWPFKEKLMSEVSSLGRESKRKIYSSELVGRQRMRLVALSESEKQTIFDLIGESEEVDLGDA